MIRRMMHERWVVPAWFICIGLLSVWVPVPTVAMGLLLLVLTVGVVPGLVLALTPRP